ncbi:MAG: hypothetical protein IJP54_09910, partial [Synergistaceae bacterium]|nr:hypothetical protein [Synergistaceae bacterium]
RSRRRRNIMVERDIAERFCIWWWDKEGEDWMQNLASLVGWPVMIETENIEVFDGGGHNARLHKD